MIFCKITLLSTGIIGWGIFVNYRDEGLGLGSLLELMYVVFFIGIEVFLEIFKLCRLKYLPKHSHKEERELEAMMTAMALCEVVHEHAQEDYDEKK